MPLGWPAIARRALRTCEAGVCPILWLITQMDGRSLSQKEVSLTSRNAAARALGGQGVRRNNGSRYCFSLEDLKNFQKVPTQITTIGACHPGLDGRGRTSTDAQTAYSRQTKSCMVSPIISASRRVAFKPSARSARQCAWSTSGVSMSAIRYFTRSSQNVSPSTMQVLRLPVPQTGQGAAAAPVDSQSALAATITQPRHTRPVRRAGD